MPYTANGILVTFEDGMCELEICTCSTYVSAVNVAQALNDAVKWREHQARISAEMPKRSHGPLIVENPNMAADAARWRKLCAQVERSRIQIVLLKESPDEYTIRVQTDEMTFDDVIDDNAFGPTLSEAIDNL